MTEYDENKNTGNEYNASAGNAESSYNMNACENTKSSADKKICETFDVSAGMNDSESSESVLRDSIKESFRESFETEIRNRMVKNPPEIPSYEEFSTMIDKDQRAFRRRRRRIAGIAACFVAAILISVAAFALPNSDVDADKNPKQEIATENGVIIEDGGWGSSDGEDNVWTTTDWEHVSVAKEIYPQILIPKYIPESYEFEKLVIENYVETNIVCEFIFSDDNDRMIEIEEIIIEGGMNSLQIDESTEKIQYKDITICIQPDTKIAITQIDDGITVHIIGEKSSNELIKIVKQLK